MFTVSAWFDTGAFDPATTEMEALQLVFYLFNLVLLHFQLGVHLFSLITE